MKVNALLVAAALVAIPIPSFAQHVDFGVLPFPATTPLGPPPCLQTGAIGGPAAPCS